MSKKINVYGDGNWIINSKPSSFEDADIVVMPGGADVNPALYGHKPIKETHWNDRTDDHQMQILNKAIELGKAIVGICRGMQILTVRSGGWLIQDSYHPNQHNIKTKDGLIINTNSCHHQQCYVYDLPDDDYELVAWAEHLSPIHIIQENVQLKYDQKSLDNEGRFKEPEIVSFSKLNSLGCQFHP